MATLDARTDLDDAVRRLTDACLFPTSGPDWQRACLETLHTEADQPRFACACSGGSALAFLPLLRAPRKGSDWLELPGFRALYEPAQIAYADRHALAELLGQVVGLGDPVELGRMVRDPIVIDTLRRCAKGRGAVLELPAPPSAYVDLCQGSASDSALVPSARRRADLRRKRRRLAASGRVDFEWFRPDVAGVDDVLARAVEIEGSGWKGRARSSLTTRGELAAFVATLARSYAARRALVVGFLNVNGLSVAMQIILVHGDAWCELKIGYDERWRAVSPGIQLAVEAARKAREERAVRYEFMGNVEARHAAFAHRLHEFVTLVYVPFTWRGLRALRPMLVGRLRRFLRAAGASSVA